MTRFHEFPDLEAVASVWLREGNITGLAGVHSSIPAEPSFPLIQVQRVGGIPAVRQYLDMARIQFDVWGGIRSDGVGISKSELVRITQQSLARIQDLEGVTMTSPVHVFVSGVDISQGVTWLPDTSTGRDRYMFTCVLFGRKMDLEEDSS